MRFADGLMLVAVVFVSLILLGCAGGPSAPPSQMPPASPPPVTTPPVTTPPVTTPPVPPTPEFKPIKLVYEVQDFMGPGSKTNITLWLEKKMTCNGRDALVGVQSLSQGQNTGWSKVTIYLDDGSFAAAQWKQESDMAFDDLAVYAQDINVYLTLNEIFALGGKNFVTDPVWNSSEPTMMKNVESMNSLANYSIFKTGKTLTDYVIPCTEFKLAEKNVGGYSGSYNLCVAEPGKDLPLPFIVAVGYDQQEGSSWTLKEMSDEKSGIVFVPQCLEPVRCSYVAWPSDSQQCQDQKGSVEGIKDEKGCVLRYECWLPETKALNRLKDMQAPNCPTPADALVKAAAACMSENMDFSVELDSDGRCMKSVGACRPMGSQ